MRETEEGEGRHRHSGDRQAKAEAEAGDAAPGVQEEAGAAPSARARGALPWLTSDSWPQNCERVNFCCFKPPSFQSFVTAATRHQHVLPPSASECVLGYW